MAASPAAPPRYGKKSTSLKGSVFQLLASCFCEDFPPSAISFVCTLRKRFLIRLPRGFKNQFPKSSVKRRADCCGYTTREFTSFFLS